MILNEDMIGVREASKILGISIPVVHYHVAQGNLTPIGKFGNSFILSRTAVEAFKEQRERQ